MYLGLGMRYETEIDTIVITIVITVVITIGSHAFIG